jgi:hypothetical protein
MTTEPSNAGRPDGMGQPALRVLASAGIKDSSQVSQGTDSQLLALHGMGPKAIGILKAALHARKERLASGQ